MIEQRRDARGFLAAGLTPAAGPIKALPSFNLSKESG